MMTDVKKRGLGRGLSALLPTAIPKLLRRGRESARGFLSLIAHTAKRGAATVGQMRNRLAVIKRCLHMS